MAVGLLAGACCAVGPCGLSDRFWPAAENLVSSGFMSIFTGLGLGVVAVVPEDGASGSAGVDGLAGVVDSLLRSTSQPPAPRSSSALASDSPGAVVSQSIANYVQFSNTALRTDRTDGQPTGQ